MRTLTRHILIQLIGVFLFSLIALTLLVVVGGAVREAVGQSLPPGQVLRLVPYMLPEWLRYTVPITLLLAATTVYSRMSGSNEMLAIKSLGISPMAVIWPALITAFLLSLGMIWVTDRAVPWGRQGFQRLDIAAVEEVAYAMLRTHKQYNSPAFSVNVKEVRDRKLIFPTLTYKQRGKMPTVTITAAEAELRSDPYEDLLEIILRNGTIEAGGVVEGQFLDEHKIEFPLREARHSARSAKAASSLSLSEVRLETNRQADDILQTQRELAARAAWQMASGDFDALTSQAWATRRRSLASKQQQFHRLQTEPCRRWAAGFTCFCFLWVGTPMAIRRRNSDFLSSFFLCFAPILIIYFPFLMYTTNASKSGAIPPIFVWSGNVVLLLWGAYLLRKVIRH